MALSIKDPQTEQLVRQLSELTDLSLTRAIRRAVVHELERLGAAGPLPQAGGDSAQRLARVASGLAQLSRHYRPMDGE